MKLKYYLRGLGIGIVVTASIMSFTRQPEKLTDTQIKARALELGMVEKNVLADLQEKEELTYEESGVEESETSEEEVTNEELNIEDSEATEEVMNEELNVEDSEATEEVANEELNVEDSEATEEVANEELNVEDSETMEETMHEELNIEDSEVREEVANEEIYIENPEVSEEVQEIEGEEHYIVISVVGGNGSETVSRKLYEAGLVDSEVAYNQFLIRNGYAKRLGVGNHEIPVGATDEEIARILCRIE